MPRSQTPPGGRPHQKVAPRGQTDACENITFPILRMRAVKISQSENTHIKEWKITAVAQSHLVSSVNSVIKPLRQLSCCISHQKLNCTQELPKLA